MSRENLRRCSAVLDDASGPLLQRARKLQRLEQATLDLLPPDLAAHCRVVNLRNETLILAAGSAAWATRLRFAIPDLIKQFRCQHALELRAIEVRIQKNPFTTQTVEYSKPVLSGASAELLAQTARGIDHPGLREALYRLASRTGKS